ncbi:hypothetical protein G9A89_001905 [Geosiphon pyriformis]|nr:hypothetical protein G9A89_001905 [Geosiphon pyriformis]
MRLYKSSKEKKISLSKLFSKWHLLKKDLTSPTKSTNSTNLASLPTTSTISSSKQKSFKLAKRISGSGSSTPLSPISDSINLLIASTDGETIMDQKYDANDKFRYIEGRRYHNVKRSRYYLPNDEKELELSHKIHKFTRGIWQSNFSSPIQEQLMKGGVRVLDVGCGSGSWIIDMAKQYPNCHFTAVDMSPLISRDSQPENVRFYEEDIIDGLSFPNETFHYVHMQNMTAAFSESEWHTAIRELERVLKRGGYIELMEYELTLHNDGPISKLLFSSFVTDLKSRGMASTIYQEMVQLLTANQRFSRITKLQVSAPFGKWAGKFGKEMAEVLFTSFRSFKTKISNILGLEPQEFDDMLETWSEEIDEYKPYWIAYRWWAQKV